MASATRRRAASKGHCARAWCKIRVAACMSAEAWYAEKRASQTAGSCGAALTALAASRRAWAKCCEEERLPWVESWC